MSPRHLGDNANRWIKFDLTLAALCAAALLYLQTTGGM